MTKAVTIQIDRELTEAVWSSATDHDNSFGAELGRLARLGLDAQERKKELLLIKGFRGTTLGSSA